MYDRPNTQELIDAARLHLEQNVIPVIKADPKLYFQTLVAINVLKIVGRELSLAPSHALAEWAGLNLLENVETPPPADLAALQSAIAERNRTLCEAIRRGDFDQHKVVLFQHVVATTTAQLEVSNPKFLQALAKE